MAKRLNKNDITRGRIFDQLAEMYGTSVLGMYEGKLRIEILDEETDEVVQFSIAPVVHKTLINETECDPYVTTKEKIEKYQASLKKNEPKPKKTKAKKETTKKVDKVIPVADFNFDEPKAKTPSVDEDAKLNALMSELGF